jgi:SAM-dependent methyltransferase
MLPTVLSAQHPDSWFDTDTQFHHLYPNSIQLLATRHWTPLHITRRVAKYLTPADNVRVLDIGSGVGKFCLAAAHCMPSAHFFGIEQRKTLVAHAETARKILGLQNIHFIHGNFTQLDFNQYDHFYFYNSFYENLVETDKIDDSILYSTELYNYYNRYLYKKLDKMRSGTRLVTFHSLEEEIPPGYHLVEAQVEGLLKCWIKM